MWQVHGSLKAQCHLRLENNNQPQGRLQFMAANPALQVHVVCETTPYPASRLSNQRTPVPELKAVMYWDTPSSSYSAGFSNLSRQYIFVIADTSGLACGSDLLGHRTDAFHATSNQHCKCQSLINCSHIDNLQKGSRWTVCPYQNDARYEGCWAIPVP